MIAKNNQNQELFSSNHHKNRPNKINSEKLKTRVCISCIPCISHLYFLLLAVMSQPSTTTIKVIISLSMLMQFRKKNSRIAQPIQTKAIGEEFVKRASKKIDLDPTAVVKLGILLGRAAFTHFPCSYFVTGSFFRVLMLCKFFCSMWIFRPFHCCAETIYKQSLI